MPESTFTFQDKDYTYAPEHDIGISELRRIKNWYPSLGDYTTFTAASALGDPEALLCVIWIGMKKAGVPRLTEPMRLPNFSVGKLMGSFRDENGENIYKSMPPIRLDIDGKPYVLDLDEQLTCYKLIQIKGWYPELGSITHLLMAIFRGDPDAMACVAWLVKEAAGELDVLEPPYQDFSVGEVIDSYELQDPVIPPDPEPPVFKGPDGKEKTYVDPPQPPSGSNSLAATPTPSGSSTAEVSPTSSTSAPRKRKPAPSSST